MEKSKKITVFERDEKGNWDIAKPKFNTYEQIEKALVEIQGFSKDHPVFANNMIFQENTGDEIVNKFMVYGKLFRAIELDLDITKIYIQTISREKFPVIKNSVFEINEMDKSIYFERIQKIVDFNKFRKQIEEIL